MDSREALLLSISSLIADYRRDEIAPATPQHVERWINQFSEGVRLPMLTELEHVLGKTYFSKKAVETFLGGLLKPGRLVGDNPADFWRTSGLLDIQSRGQSQADMLRIFGRLLKQTCGVSVDECAPDSGRFIYLDDAQFTGFRALNDLSAWLSKAPEESRIIILSMAQHSGSMPLIRTNLSAAAKAAGKKIIVESWRCTEIENRKMSKNQSEVLWPAKLPDDVLVREYSEDLARAGYPPVLRDAGKMGANRFFSSEAGRDLLEQEFLKAGVRIRKDSPRLNEYQRPLGNSILKTLGFGSLVVTYRNCPNNSPLALWASEPWYPLFLRKTT